MAIINSGKLFCRRTLQRGQERVEYCYSGDLPIPGFEEGNLRGTICEPTIEKLAIVLAKSNAGMDSFHNMEGTGDITRVKGMPVIVDTPLTYEEFLNLGRAYESNIHS
jgi:hypothetical protein